MFEPDFAGPLDWAAMYHSYGLQVVPAAFPAPGAQWKRPTIKWREHENALVDSDQIAQWFRRAQHSQMGIITGACSGIFVVDLDTHKGPSAMAWWQGVLAVENSGLDLETAIVTTGGGGKQYYFRTPEFWMPPTNKTSIGVDIRGQGGFVMAPPSMHESGREYAWDAGCAPWEIDILEAPQWLCDAIDKLVGGISQERSAILDRHHQTAASAGTHNGVVADGLGQVIDGREELATTMVWAAVLDWWRECPIKPSPNESVEKCREVYAVYERKCKPRKYEPNTPRSLLLEREGRGYTMFEDKWRRAMAQWDGKVSDAAAHLPAHHHVEPARLTHEIKREVSPQTYVADEFGEIIDDEFGGGSSAGAKAVAGEGIDTDLRSTLSIEAWAVRDIPEPDRILGDFLTTTVRAFLVGRTGLGKTLLGIAIAAAAASGSDFLTWKAYRPVNVLYIDGEMPAELIKPRAIDAMRRLGDVKIPTGNLMIFGRDIEDEARRVCPDLPPFAPLNTDGGRAFLMSLIDAVGGVDLVVFDNVMSLLEGDQKDELAWSAVLDLVTYLTTQRIGQLWLDHTGHNNDRQYGSSTKAWRFDAVGVMAPLKDEDQGDEDVPGGATGFSLSFDHPGKARRRTPDNWQQFQAQIVRLVDDRWVWEPANASAPGKQDGGLKASARAFYEALLDAVVRSGTPGRTTKAIWLAECQRKGLVDTFSHDDDAKERNKKTGPFRARLSELVMAKYIGVDGETVNSLK